MVQRRECSEFLFIIDNFGSFERVEAWEVTVMIYLGTNLIGSIVATRDQEVNLVVCNYFPCVLNV